MMQSKLRISHFNVSLAIIVIYSIIIVFSGSPAIQRLSNYTTLVYYLFIPGYVFTLFLSESYNILWRLLYSAMIGLALVLSVASLGSSVFGAYSVPLNVIIPSISIMLVIYLYAKSKIHY